MVTLTAAGPFGPCSASYETRAPSASVRKPSPAMPEKWTKRSLPGSSGVMNPKPLSSLNHFTVPVAMLYLHGVGAANAEDAWSNQLRSCTAYPGLAGPGRTRDKVAGTEERVGFRPPWWP